MNQQGPVSTALDCPHSKLEDGLALLVGAVTIAFGLLLLRQGGIATGGTAGIALFLHYAFGLAFGLTFFVLNLPFYYLAVRRMGWAFSIKTFVAIGLVSWFSDHLQALISIQHIHPLYAAVIGNIILAMGFLALFRHRSSLGGLNIFALYLQDRLGWRAGWVQMICDLTILGVSLSVMTLPVWLMSVLGAVILNLILALNHRAGRYRA